MYVVDLKERVLHKEDAKTHRKMLGYKDNLSITNVCRAALVLQFKDLKAKTSFFKKKMILYELGGDWIYLDENLNKM
jgi:Na+/phosphate symporter